MSYKCIKRWRVICVVNGVILQLTKIIVPSTLRVSLLAFVYEGHLGNGQCKALARQLILWPGINKDIQNIKDKS